ncbi:hypothetical protein H2204_000374 [Knufia peltigerae]|uniref:Enoyl-CoA hydratase n=1 Tax=Knufia peltigerae TaxID=1002370 RepID=A0AA39D470_9EURO|nr:hypothetical protein H2204_000374 [Knufia peltigerae]
MAESNSSGHGLTTPPPMSPCWLLDFPVEHVLLVVLNNPKSLNCLTTDDHWSLDALFQWYDNEPSLRCCVVTGQGRAFCAGADLKEWDRSNSRVSKGGPGLKVMPQSGFAGLSRRGGKKPIIGAVNGLAYGGGMEMVANLDLVVASKSATFALPEVKRGVAAIAGSLPRLMRIVGRARAMDMALTGRAVTAQDAQEWGVINSVTEDAPADAKVTSRPVVKKAMEYAKVICDNSPDSIIVTRAGLVSAWEDGSVEHATTAVMEIWQRRLNQGENIHEGVRAFVEKRSPKWVGSRL